MKELLPKYFSSQWSFAQCRVSEDPCVASFGLDPTTILGTYPHAAHVLLTLHSATAPPPNNNSGLKPRILFPIPPGCRQGR